MILHVFKYLAVLFRSGNLIVIIASCILFCIQEYCNLTKGFFSVGASVFEQGHLHKLFLYSLYHKTGEQLLLNILAFAFLSGSLERGFGTVRFLFMFFLLSTTTGLAYAFLDFLQGNANQTEGLLSTALACMALTTTHTKTTKGFLCGVTFPTIALPWVFLIITIFIPNNVLPCNILAICTGWMYGKGWFSLVQMSEARACVLEKMMLFKFLRSCNKVMFVPASIEERRKTLLPQVSATPATYPVQAYAPVSTVTPHNPVATTYEGWPSHTNGLDSAPVPLHPHGHPHSHIPVQSYRITTAGLNMDHSYNHNCHQSSDSDQK